VRLASASIVRVLATVDFNDEARLVTREIHDVTAEPNLSAKMRVVHDDGS
jgi:hypothetical protein